MHLGATPETDHDLLISLWTLLIGTNGDGLLGKFEKFTEKTDGRLDGIEKQLPMCWTRDDHEEAEKKYAAKDAENLHRRRISAREWILVAVAIVGPIAAVVVAKILG